MIQIGTSGWHYAHWRGAFYPHGTRPQDMLPFYARHFSTVEINNSFYHLPAPETFRQWHQATPDPFIFAVKASRYMTHMKKLKEPQGTTQKFFNSLRALKDKLGPVLFQLPPRWHCDVKRLENFLKALPTTNRYAFEFRDRTWFNEEIYAVLKQYGAAFCIYDMGGTLSVKIITSDFIYVRLHGPERAYQGKYQDKTLGVWAKVFREWEKAGKDIYCYFDNDQAGYAAQDAARLLGLLGREGPNSVTPKW